jgi:hypothetical protein
MNSFACRHCGESLFDQRMTLLCFADVFGGLGMRRPEFGQFAMLRFNTNRTGDEPDAVVMIRGYTLSACPWLETLPEKVEP